MVAATSIDATSEVRERLLSYAKMEAEKIIREAEEEAKRIVEDSEKEWLRKYQDYRAKEMKLLHNKASQIESEARLRARLLISKVKEDVISSLFKEVEGLLAKRGFNVERSLEVLLTKSLEELSSPPRMVRVSSKDVELAKSVLKKMGMEGVLVEGDPAMIGGIVVEGEGGNIVDNSYETRLSILRERLLDRIRSILWEGLEA